MKIKLAEISSDIDISEISGACRESNTRTASSIHASKNSKHHDILTERPPEIQMDASDVACVRSPGQAHKVFHVLLLAAGDPSATRQLLTECSYRVTLCTTHPLEFLAGSHHCDIVLLDLEKPDHGGMQMVAAISQIYPHIPVVVVASDDTHHSVLTAFQAGAADYLIKPVRHNELATLWQHVWRANQQPGQQRYALGSSPALEYTPQQPCNSTLFPAHAGGHPYIAYQQQQQQQQHVFPTDKPGTVIGANTLLTRKGSDEAGMGPANHNSSGASTSNQQEHSTALLSTGAKAVKGTAEGARGGNNTPGAGIMVREGSSSDVATNFESHLRYAATTAPHHANKGQAQSVLSAGMAQPPAKVVSGAARLAAAAVAALREGGSATLSPLQALFSGPSRVLAKSGSPHSASIRAGYATSNLTVAAAAVAAAMKPAPPMTGSSWEELTLVAKRLQLPAGNNWHSSNPYTAIRPKTPETGDSTSVFNTDPNEPAKAILYDDLTASSRRSSLEQQNGVTAQAAAVPNPLQPGWADVQDDGSNAAASADTAETRKSQQLQQQHVHQIRASQSAEVVDAAVPLLRGLLVRPQARRITPATRTQAQKGGHPLYDGLPQGLLRLAAAAEKEQELLQQQQTPTHLVRSSVTPRLGRRPTSKRQLDEQAVKRSSHPLVADADADQAAYKRQTAKTVAEWQGGKGIIISRSSSDGVVPSGLLSGQRSPPQAMPLTPVVGQHRKRSAFSGFCAPQAARQTLLSQHPPTVAQTLRQPLPGQHASPPLTTKDHDQPQNFSEDFTACSAGSDPVLEIATAAAAAKRQCQPQSAAAHTLHLHPTHSRPEHHQRQLISTPDSASALQQHPLAIHQLSHLPPASHLQDSYGGIRGPSPFLPPFPPHMHPANPYSSHPPINAPSLLSALQSSGGGGGGYNSTTLLNQLQLSNLMRNQDPISQLQMSHLLRNQDPAFTGLHLHNNQQQQHNIALHHTGVQNPSAMHFAPNFNEQSRFAGLPQGSMGLDPMMQLLASLQHGSGPHHHHQSGKPLALPSLPPLTHPTFRVSQQSLLASFQANAGQQQQMAAAAAAFGGTPLNFGKLAAGPSVLATAGAAAVPAPAAAAFFSSGRSIMTAQRSAALAKYMEKRKHRKFHKKVRYESRKRLAESRPRVRGQFVKQEAQPNPAATAPQPLPRSPTSGPDTPATPSPTTSTPALIGSASASPDGTIVGGTAYPGTVNAGSPPGVIPANLSPAGAAVAAAALSTFLKNISRLSSLSSSGTTLLASAAPAQVVGTGPPLSIQVAVGCPPGTALEVSHVGQNPGHGSDGEDEEDSDEEGGAGQDSDDDDEKDSPMEA